MNLSRPAGAVSGQTQQGRRSDTRAAMPSVLSAPDSPAGDAAARRPPVLMETDD